ncbi:unnamed protein product, partial [marine sediment metagenome]
MDILFNPSHAIDYVNERVEERRIYDGLIFS